MGINAIQSVKIAIKGLLEIDSFRTSETYTILNENLRLFYMGYLKNSAKIMLRFMIWYSEAYESVENLLVE